MRGPTDRQFNTCSDLAIDIDRYLNSKRLKKKEKQQRRFFKIASPSSNDKYRALCTSRGTSRSNKPKITIPLNIGNSSPEPKFGDLSSIHRRSFLNSYANLSDSKISEEKVSLKSIIGMIKNDFGKSRTNNISRFDEIYSQCDTSVFSFKTENLEKSVEYGNNGGIEFRNLKENLDFDFRDFTKNSQKVNKGVREKLVGKRVIKKIDINKLRKDLRKNFRKKDKSKTKSLESIRKDLLMPRYKGNHEATNQGENGRNENYYKTQKKVYRKPQSTKTNLKINFLDIKNFNLKKNAISPKNILKTLTSKNTPRSIFDHQITLKKETRQKHKLDFLTSSEKKKKIKNYFKKKFRLEGVESSRRKEVINTTERGKDKSNGRFEDIKIEKLIKLNNKNKSLTDMLARNESLRRGRASFKGKEKKIVFEVMNKNILRSVKNTKKQGKAISDRSIAKESFVKKNCDFDIIKKLNFEAKALSRYQYHKRGDIESITTRRYKGLERHY